MYSGLGDHHDGISQLLTKAISVLACALCAAGAVSAWAQPTQRFR
jgi:hypothetical protein